MKRYYWIIPFVVLLGAIALVLSIPGIDRRDGGALVPYLSTRIQHGSLNADSWLPPNNIAEQPDKFLKIVVFFMLIPPLPLIHLWLLAQVYRHAYQPGERFKPYLYSGIITIPITLVEISGLCAWIWIEYQHIFQTSEAHDNAILLLWVLVSTLSLLFAVLGAIHICRKRSFSLVFQRRMIRSSLEVSLIVAIGIAGGLFYWVVIAWGILGFIIYRFAMERHFMHYELTIQLTALDQFVLDQMSLTSIAMLASFCVAKYFFSIGNYYNQETFFQVLSLVFCIVLGGISSSLWGTEYGFSISGNRKKKGWPKTSHTAPWFSTMALYTGLWVALTVGIWYLMLMAWRFI